jgi:hypothetical protein
VAQVVEHLPDKHLGSEFKPPGLFFVFVCVLISPYKDIGHIGLGPSLVPHFNLITSLNIVTFCSVELRLQTSTYELGGGGL